MIRPRDQTEEDPSTQRRKLNEDEDKPPLVFFNLPIDAISHIVSFLPRRALFQFPALAKNAAAFTEKSFKEIKRQKQWNLEGSFYEKESYPQRASYISVILLNNYLVWRGTLIKSNKTSHSTSGLTEKQVKTIYETMQEKMKRFSSSIGRFIWKDLNSMVCLQSPDEKLFLEDPSSKPSESEHPPSFSGDELLKGLSYLTTYCNLKWKVREKEASALLDKALPHLKNAMDLGATAAAYFGIKILVPFLSSTPTPVVDYCKQLATLSASYQDYSAWHLMVYHNVLNNNQEYENGSRYPPILAIRAFEKQKEAKIDNKVLDSLWEEVIKGYKDPAFIPSNILKAIGINKSRLKEHKKTEEYLEIALQKITHTLNEEDQLEICNLLMYTKICLSKWKEAEKCSKKVIFLALLTNTPCESITWARIALIKTYVQKSEEANACLSKALTCKTDPDVYSIGLKIRIIQQRWQDAEHLLQKRLSFSKKLSPDEQIDAAQIKAALKKWPEAKEYIDQALEAYGSNIPPHVQKLADEIHAQYYLLNKSSETSNNI